MVARHDWITLYANGIRYLEKAPLMYWCMAASFTVFGPQDWAARIPLAIAALALFLVVYRFGRRLFDFDTAGLYAALDPAYVFWHFHLHPHHHSRRDRLPSARLFR